MQGDNSNGDSSFDVALAACLKRIDACHGDPAKSPTLEELISDFPQYESQLREFFHAEDSVARRLAATVSSFDQEAAGRQLPDIPGYDVFDCIGRGAMGFVFRARQQALGRNVALKVVSAGHLPDSRSLQRFENEARISASLQHPNIVRVHDFGSVAGQPYYSMDFIDGYNLRFLSNGIGMPAKEAARIVAAVSRAVDYAHQSQIVHRDIKPSNILIRSIDGTPLVADFGLAKSLLHDCDLTVSEEVLGTPAYMSPESVRGQATEFDSGKLADVYGLGATLYHLITGKPPYTARSSTKVLQLVLESDPQPPRKYDNTIPRDLQTICLKCLERDPLQRYRSAAEVALELQRFLDGEAISARPPSLLGQITRWSKRRPATAVSIVFSLLLLVGFWGFLRNRELELDVRAEQAIEALVNAESASVEDALNDVSEYGDRAAKSLRTIAQVGTSQNGARAALALLKTGAFRVDESAELVSKLSHLTPCNLRLASEALAANRSSFKPIINELWNLSADSSLPIDRCVSALGILAPLVPEDDRWPLFASSCCEKLAQKDSLEASLWRKQFQPVGRAFESRLEQMLLRAEEPLTGMPRLAAVQSLVEYSPQSINSLLAVLFRTTEPIEFDALFPALQLSQRALDEARQVVHSDLDRIDAEDLHLKRSRAALLLWRAGFVEETRNLLVGKQDNSCRSQVVCEAHSFGIPFGALWELRHDLSSTDELYSLLIAIGPYGSDGQDRQRRPHVVDFLQQTFESHPHSGVHSAAMWSLEQWTSRREVISRIKKLSSELPAEHATWYVNGQGQTMIVLKPGEFVVGDMDSHEPTESLNATRVYKGLPRFAISAHEVTIQQWERFESAHPEIDYIFAPGSQKTLDTPSSGHDWHETAAYCNWLSEQEGIPPEQWCYRRKKPIETEDPETTEKLRMETVEDYSERVGYRMPTEVEWEYAGRGKTITHCYFGSPRMSDFFAFSSSNSQGRTWPVGRLRPNALGMFDILGNVAEWTDRVPDYRYAGYEYSRAPRGHNNVVPINKLLVFQRTLAPSHLRGAINIGFRIARTLPPVNNRSTSIERE